MSLSPEPAELAKCLDKMLNGIALNLRNIYVANVKAYCTNGAVTIAGDLKLSPDEKFMRFIEDQADIPEQGADGFRRIVWGGWCDGGNVGFLDSRLRPVFDQLAKAFHAVNRALMIYPNNMDLSAPK